jgi:hypothetical protein
MHTVASLFHTPDAALRTLADLRAAGIDPQQVSVVAHPPSAAELAHETTAPSVAADQLVDARVLALPAIGSVLVAGPIAAALGVAETTTSAGTEIESSASSLAGVLVGWGLAESEARDYAGRVALGDILLAVAAPEDATAGRIGAILMQNGADRVSFDATAATRASG